MLISYTSDREVIITTKENEAKCIQLYFTEAGRDLDDYDRFEHGDHSIDVKSRMMIG